MEKIKAIILIQLLLIFFYLVLIIPGLYLLNDPQLSRYWFFILLLIYLIIYSRLYRLTKINLIYKTTIKWASGGIGIRAGLRNQCRKA